MFEGKCLGAVRADIGTLGAVQAQVRAQAVLVRERLAAVRANVRPLT